MRTSALILLLSAFAIAASAQAQRSLMFDSAVTKISAALQKNKETILYIDQEGMEKNYTPFEVSEMLQKDCGSTGDGIHRAAHRIKAEVEEYFLICGSGSDAPLKSERSYVGAMNKQGRLLYFVILNLEAKDKPVASQKPIDYIEEAGSLIGDDGGLSVGGFVGSASNMFAKKAMNLSKSEAFLFGTALGVVANRANDQRPFTETIGPGNRIQGRAMNNLMSTVSIQFNKAF